MKKREAIEGELASIIEANAMWRSLIEHPAWKNFESLVEQQMRLRQATVCLTPLSSFGKSLEQEFMKGEAAGLGLATAMVHTQYEVTKLEKETLSIQLEQEIEYEKTGKTHGGSRVDDPNFSRE